MNIDQPLSLLGAEMTSFYFAASLAVLWFQIQIHLASLKKPATNQADSLIFTGILRELITFAWSQIAPSPSFGSVIYGCVPEI